MQPTEVPTLLASWRDGPWYQREALLAWRRGDFLVIPGRNDADVYLLRFWLSAAVRRPASDGGEAIESGDSLMLHYFARGDDDQALHDHPWDFRTTILSGGYHECLPPITWHRGTIDNGPGPAWCERQEWRSVGDTIGHLSTDLHCVSGGACTFTLVRTGPRVRSWGFHPPGQPWIGYREFLGLDVAKATA